MAQQEEPLYDFPEPAAPSEHKWLGHQRGQGSLRNISVLDRLLLSLPVWLQLSINPATALHILQKEPPGAFLVRKSRTSRRNVLCVRLVDDSVPSFVQQFGIREEHSMFCLETSAISFPDVPRLIAFYCVSRDVLPFPLELPEAIARATSHKQLESISHMGVEFWSSQLNFRGPREAHKAHKEKAEPLDAPQPMVAPQTSSATQPDSDPQLNMSTDAAASQSKPTPTLFHEFCPIRTRSPRELNCSSGLGALCFVNPLFLQSQTALHRRRMFKRSLKIRVSTETSSPLSPPLAPPPPPPLMPKTKGRCKAKVQAVAQPGQGQRPSHSVTPASPSQPTHIDPTSIDTQVQPPQPQDTQVQPQGTQVQPQGIQVQPQPQGTQVQAQPQPSQFHPQMQEQDQTQDQTQMEPGQSQPVAQATAAATKVERPPDDSDYMQPSPRVNLTPSPSFSLSLPPSLSPRASPCLFPKISPSRSPHDSPSISPGVSPSLSPYQSPCASPQVPFSLSPFISPTVSPLVEEAYHTPTTPLGLDRGRKEEDVVELGGDDDDEEEEEEEEEEEDDVEKEEEMGLLLQQIYASSLNDTDSCSSLSSLEEAGETPPPTPLQQDGGTSPGLQ
ncbi:uncharacterized protein ACJ7VT_006966 [Polymixia lowei]